MAQHRHKRETPAAPSSSPSRFAPSRFSRVPRSVLVSAPIAVVATMSAVTMGVLGATPPATSDDDNLLAASSAVSTSSADTQSFANSAALARRGKATVSRSQIRTAARAESAARQELEELAVDKRARQSAKKVDNALWTTEVLNLWDGPSDKAEKMGVIGALEQVSVTGRRQMGRAQVVIDGQSRWVSAVYLVKSKPKPEPEAPAGPTLGGACANGSVIDAGRASLYEIHDVVCANWPEITSYGTWRSDGEHGQGRAIDIMVSGETGWAIAEFLRANYSALGIEYIIYSQQMWSVERSGEGWRYMSDRGSTTANHYDHVHVTVY